MKRFLKMHGLGNDFVVLDLRDGGPAPDAEAARRLADRRRGVGFDQLVMLAPPREGGDGRVVFLNADGSPSAACGNGARCAAGLVMAERKLDRLTLETDAGPLRAWREPDGRVTVDMGPPVLEWAEIPLAREVELDALPLDGPNGAPSAVSMGNPHCVFFVDDVEAVDLHRLGPRFETDPLFPQRTNVEFVQPLTRDLLRVRVWERGVGVTQACGTGACAVQVAARRRGLTGDAATIRLDGGDLRIAWAPGRGVRMTGPVSTVYEGALADDFFAASP
jgi:diaminopimelate epimerase